MQYYGWSTKAGCDMSSIRKCASTVTMRTLVGILMRAEESVLERKT
jgi:hypothetical protein